MLGNEASCSAIVKIHPLVALNISEHWSRLRLEKNEDTVWGVLLGHKDSKGREFEAVTSFDIKLQKNIKQGSVSLENDKVSERLQQYAEVFPDLEYVGWYTASTPSPNETLSLPKDSVILHLAAFLNMPANKLPLFAYVVDDKGIAQRAEWSLQSEASERIGVEHVTRLSKAVGDANATNVSRHLHTQASTVDMMLSKLRIVQRWLESVDVGNVPYDPVIAREAAKIIDMAAQIKPKEKDFDEHLNQHLQDISATQLLTKITKLIGADYHAWTDTLRLKESAVTAAGVDLGDGDELNRTAGLAQFLMPGAREYWNL